MKVALFKIFGRVLGGPWGWIATEIGERLFTKVLKPLYQLTLRKVRVYIKKKTFKKKGKRVEEAKNENDFDSSFDDLD